MRTVNILFVIMGAVILIMLPLTLAVYDFQTDLQTDIFTNCATAPADTTYTTTLSTALYGNNVQTISYASSLSTDVPAYSSYNSTNRNLVVMGLTDNSTRTLTIAYDVDALGGSAAINTFVGYVPFFWMAIILIFPAAVVIAIFIGRA